MRFKIVAIKPKKERTEEDKITRHYIDFVKELVNYPLKPTRAVLIMDQASYHRVEEATKFLSESGISIYFLPSGSSELNPIEKCRY